MHPVAENVTFKAYH